MNKKQNQPLWTPTEQQIETATLTAFLQRVSLSTYSELHKWSVTHLEEFWREVWDFCGIHSFSKRKA